MIAFLGWLLVGLCSALLIVIAVAPLFIRDGEPNCVCRECRKRDGDAA